jgi:hypothetical protein
MATKHNLSLEVLETANTKLFRLVDTSTYSTQLSVECPTLEILAPGFNEATKIDAIAGFNYVLNACTLGLQASGCDTINAPIADGIYVVRYSVSPNEYVNVEYNHLRLTQTWANYYYKLSKLLASAGYEPSREVSESLSEMRFIKSLLEGAVGKVEFSHDTDGGYEIFKYALTRLEKVCVDGMVSTKYRCNLSTSVLQAPPEEAPVVTPEPEPDTVPPQYQVDSLVTTLDTDSALSGTNLLRVTFTDPGESYPLTFSLTGLNTSLFTLTSENANNTSWLLTAASNIPAGTYTFTGTVADSGGVSAPVSTSLTVSAVAPPNVDPVVTVTELLSTPDTNTALDGANLYRISVSDSDNSPGLSVSIPGLDTNLFTLVNVSATVWQVQAAADIPAGNYTFLGTATESDGGSASFSFAITVAQAVVPNQPADVTVTQLVTNPDTNNALTGVDLYRIEASDPDNSGAVALTIPGLDTNLFSLVAGVTGTWFLRAATNIPANTYSFSGSAVDGEGLPTPFSITLTVANAAVAPVVSVTPLITPLDDTTALAATPLFRVRAVFQTTGPHSISMPLTVNGTTFTESVTDIDPNTKDYTYTPTTDLAAGTYSFTGSVTDGGNGLSTSVSYSGVVADTTAPSSTDVYFYGSTRGASSISDESSTLAAFGYNSADPLTPIADSPYALFKSGSIGSASLTVPGGTVSLKASAVLTDTLQLNTLGAIDMTDALQQIIILIPDTTDIANVPHAMYNGALPSAAPQSGTYSLYVNDAIPGTVGAVSFPFSTTTPINGYSNWIAVISYSGAGGNNVYDLYNDFTTP